MNKKAIMKIAVAALACVAMNMGALAAPKGNKPPAPAKHEMRGKTPAKPAAKATQKAPAKAQAARPAPAHGRDMAHHNAPAPRHEARPPAPAPRHNPSPPKHLKHHRHDDNDGWLMLGAGIVGGIVGAIVGG